MVPCSSPNSCTMALTRSDLASSALRMVWRLSATVGQEPAQLRKTFGLVVEGAQAVLVDDGAEALAPCRQGGFEIGLVEEGRIGSGVG